jgi:hypothetical protein
LLAYIDPGAGAAVAALLAGGAAGLGVLVRSTLAKLRGKDRPSQPVDAAAPPSETAPHR